MSQASGNRQTEQSATTSRVSSSQPSKASAGKAGAKKQSKPTAKKTSGRKAAVIPHGNAKTKSGIPKGSSAAYVAGKGCGKGKHNYVMAKSNGYAVCSKCHSRRSFSQ